MAKEKVTIKVPKDLYNRLANIIENTGFSSVTDLIVYTMRDVAAGGNLDNELTPKEVDKVRQRLKALGYL